MTNCNEMNYTWDDDDQAIRVVKSEGVEITREFMIQGDKNFYELPVIVRSAINYLVWEWDFGPYRKKS